LHRVKIAFGEREFQKKKKKKKVSENDLGGGNEGEKRGGKKVRKKAPSAELTIRSAQLKWWKRGDKRRTKEGQLNEATHPTNRRHK